MDQANKLRNLMKKITKKNFVFHSRVICVISGKGGVGKSNFTLNMAINFSEKGKKVAIVDADFGMANIEVLCGSTPNKSILNLLNGENTIDEIMISGPKDISIISGGSGIVDLSNLASSDIDKLLENLKLLDSKFDIILIDTSAGFSEKVLSMVKISKEIILITTPEPTAVADTYATIKVLRSMQNKRDMFIAINRVEDKNEGEDVFFKLNRMSNRFLNIELKILGYIPDDNLLKRAVKKQEPVSIIFPNSSSAKNISYMSNMLLGAENKENKEVQNHNSASIIQKFINKIKK
ncbi:MAG: MinD/ParA family protein [Defluviitaleaceae bacterium]|nr:MinD/ParA family protein [Defluviitaleaceae bacterium]